MRRAARWSLVAFLSLVVAATTGVLASNSLPATKLGQDAAAITANSLKPSSCSSVNVTNVVTGPTGSAGNDLVLGTSGADALVGDDGDDCIIGGAGTDTITGGAGNDVCIGSAGAVFASCETELTA